MGGEQAHDARAFRLVVEEHALHLVGRLQRGPPLDLAQGRDHRVRVLGQLHRPGIGHILARPRQHHPDDKGQGKADGGDGQSDQDQRPGVLVVAPSAAREEQTAEHQLRHHAQDAGEDGGDDHRPHILVDHMGQLMGQHGLDLVPVKGVDQTPGDGDAVAPLVQTRRIGVQLVRLDDAQRRRLHTPGNRQILEQVIQLGILPALDLPRAGHRVDHGLVAEIGDGEPDGGHHARGRHGPAQHAGGQRHVVAQGAARAGNDPEAHQDQLQAIEHQHQQHREHGQQHDRARVVRPDMGLEPDGLHGA